MTVRQAADPQGGHIPAMRIVRTLASMHHLTVATRGGVVLWVSEEVDALGLARVGDAFDGSVLSDEIGEVSCGLIVEVDEIEAWTLERTAPAPCMLKTIGAYGLIDLVTGEDLSQAMSLTDPVMLMLILGVAGPVSREAVMEALWPRVDERYRRETFKKLMSRLRKQWTQTTGREESPVISSSTLKLDRREVVCDASELSRYARIANERLACGESRSAAAVALEAFRTFLSGPLYGLSVVSDLPESVSAGTGQRFLTDVADLARVVRSLGDLHLSAEVSRRMNLHAASMNYYADLIA